jgi:hypothetical protein
MQVACREIPVVVGRLVAMAAMVVHKISYFLTLGFQIVTCGILFSAGRKEKIMFSHIILPSR